MTDREATSYIRDLMEYNRNDQLKTPQSSKFDTFYQCAFEHAVRALETYCPQTETAIELSDPLKQRFIKAFCQYADISDDSLNEYHKDIIYRNMQYRLNTPCGNINQKGLNNSDLLYTASFEGPDILRQLKDAGWERT